MLSPADVEQKTFSTALRGYDLDEVDDFLDEIVATIKELNEQLEAARAARDEEATAPPAPVPVPEPEPDQEPETAETRQDVDESAIGRALVAAQNAADQLLEEAQSQADRILEEAKDQADSFAAERDAKKREVEAEIAALSERVSSVRSELSVLAGEVAEKLDDMDQVLTGAAGETDTGPAVDEGDEAETPDAVSVVDDMPDDLDSDDTDLDSADTPDDVDSDDNLDFGDTPGGGERDEESGGSDHLDEILTGVTNDLRLDSDVPETIDEDSGDSEDSDVPEGSDDDGDSDDSDEDADEH